MKRPKRNNIVEEAKSAVNDFDSLSKPDAKRNPGLNYF
jgi:hypothetical protein